MATLLLPPGRTSEVETPPLVGTATLRVVLSPVRNALGHFRTVQSSVIAGQSVAAALADEPLFDHVIWNGATLTPEQQTKVILQPGDEVTVFPTWGEPFTASLLITFAVGVAISLATTALSYLLFPPSKPHIEAPDPHTFSFEGIRTAIGPGNIKPVIYGHHRVGGQLLSASVTQALTVLSNENGTFRVTASDTPPTLDLLLAFGEGPISEFLLGTLEINGQPLGNFPGVQVFTRLGTPDQTPIVEFNETRNTFADGRDLPDNSANTGQEIVYTTSEPISAFVLNIVWQAGLFHMNGKGEKEDNMVNLAYRFRVHGTPNWSAYGVHQVNAARTAPVRFGIRREGLDLATYDIAVNFGGIRHQDELKSKWQPTLESVTEVQAGAHAYPYTALLGLRAVATDALQGALPNITVEVHGRTTRASSFGAAEVFDNNPAWCIMDLMTNTRYGMGIPESEIDLAAFQVWAEYCADLIGGEQRHRFNYVLEREGRSQSLLMEMMGGSRTLMLRSEGLWSPRVTRNDPPGPLLSWATCTNLKVTYTRDPDRVNVMEARFANEEDKFEQDVLAWPPVDQWPPEVHKAGLELRGVTKPSRVMRAMQFELNRRAYENLVIEFDNALDAVTMQVHDLFRFSHPMPGWGASGRIQEGSTNATIYLDQDVHMTAGITYQLYIKHNTDFTESRIVFNPGDTTTHILQFAVPFTGAPDPGLALWAFGTASPDGAVRVFRAVRVERKSDTTVHIQAVVHNPTIYDEPTAIPVPGTPGLPNPLGVPPALRFLVATEVTRVQASGASVRVVNLAWDVAPVGGGQAPYGGAKVFRRTVLFNSAGGQMAAGAVDLGASQNPNDQSFNYALLTQVTGHTLELDDFTVSTNSTYIYRVVPVSGRGVPNEAGSLETLIHVSGSTTPDYFPGTVRNLRLKGKAVGVTTWEGRDVHLEWDAVADSPLFSETFFVNNYIVQVWAPGQAFLLRTTTTGGVQSFTYSWAMNEEDHRGNGIVGAQRDIYFLVFAYTNTGRMSLDPATLLAHNPPPDMSNILPDTVGLFEVGIISWDQFIEPVDFDHYEVHLDIMDPPIGIYVDVSVSFHGQGSSFRKVAPQGLTANVIYYTFILPYDTFGPGVRSQTAQFSPRSLTADMLDTIPPDTPTGLTLTTGTDMGDDGTVFAWVEAHWTLAPESDVARYEVHVFVGTSPVPTVWNPDRLQNTIRFHVPGKTQIRVKLLASDRFANNSAFTAEATIMSAGDGTPPAAPENLNVFGSIRSVALLWTPPADSDYTYSEVWVSQTNNRANAISVGSGTYSFVHDSMGADDTRWYWIRAVDTSGNVSPFHPLSATGGVPGTAGQLDTTFISSLAASKIITGTLTALVTVGVAGRIFLDGVNRQIYIIDEAGTVRVILGKLGALSTDWGMHLFNAAGQAMWSFTDGALTPGISNAAITAPKIAAGAIVAGHIAANTIAAGDLRTDTAVITTAAQIAFAIIDDAKITNLSASKLIAGSVITNLLYLGFGLRVQIDGNNLHIRIYDEFDTLRIVLGRLGPEPTNWGLIIFDQFGNLMWSTQGGGAQTPGIAQAAVITEKIFVNAVTEAVVFVSSGGNVGTLGNTLLASMTWPQLDPGDQVWFVGTARYHGVSGGGIATSMFFREDDENGPTHHTSTFGGFDSGGSTQWGPLAVQAVYTNPVLQFNKRFVLAASGNGIVDEVRLAALRRRR